jgi:hypothetical protein
MGQGTVVHHRRGADFYAENGNRYNCYCSQIPVLLNDDGSIFNEGLAEKLRKSGVIGSHPKSNLVKYTCWIGRPPEKPYAQGLPAPS